MQKLLLRFFTAVIRVWAMLLSTATYCAAPPVVHVAPKPNWISAYKPYAVKPPTRNVENGAYDELIEEQVNVEQKATYNHFITQIISESGVQNNSDISVNFNPEYERLDFHDITVWRDGKPQPRLNISAFKMLADESETDKFIYNGTYSAKCILSDIRKGDRIEYSYTLTGRNPVFNNKFCRSIYLQGSGLIVHQFTTLIFAADRKLNIKPFNLRSQPKVYTTGNLKRYEWEDFQVPGAISNKRQPDWVNNYARVQVSDFGTWAEVVDWAMKINPLKTSFKGELAAAIAKLKAEAGTDKDRYFRNAVKLVQDEVRYMGVETGEYSHRANDPEKVYERRYGDCKDKALLLASILKNGGIDAAMALVNTGLKDKIDNFLPSSAMFNHAVVQANVNGKEVWVDATMGYQRGTGTNIYFPAYARALVLKAGNNSLAHIPVSKTGKITCAETYIVRDAKDSTELLVETKYTLNQADDTRDRLASSSSSETEKSYLDYYSKIYPSIEREDSLKVIDDEEKNELTTIEKYKIGNYLKRDTTANKYYGEFYANAVYYELTKIDGQIKTPVSVNYPYDLDYSVKIVVPIAWTLEEKQSEIVRDSYAFHFNRFINGDTLTLHYRFAYLKDFVPANKLSELRADVKEISDNKLSFSFYYTPAAMAAANNAIVNVNMLVFAVIVLFVCVFLAVLIYQKHTSSVRLSGDSYGRPLGGWLILIMFGLFATVINVSYGLVTGYFFKMGSWNTYTTGSKSILFKVLIAFETGGNVLTICYAAFCLVLIFRKRDILPAYISGYFIYCLAFLVLDYCFAAYFVSASGSSIGYGIFRAIVVAAIWVPYFNRSTRVKETFITPYPNYNIIYEDPETQTNETLLPET